MEKSVPFNLELIKQVAKRYPTPFHIYDETQIIANSKELYNAMQNVGFSDFKNYFAIKALPNPYIMEILAELGHGMDASSIAEIELCKMVGIRDVIYSSNNTTDDDFARAIKEGAIINFDDISHVRRFIKKFGTPKIACCRYNPGKIKFKGGEESIIGSPHEAKFGMPYEHILEAYGLLKKAGTRTFGLHTMLLSNNLDWNSHIKIADLLFEIANKISKKLDITFDFIDLGGGIGVAYHPNDHEFNMKLYSENLRAIYDKYFFGSNKPRIVMENGRFITASSGYLVTRVINRKDTHKTYIGVDANMANLMRPGMYGAYHPISVLGGSNREYEIVDVTGSLCENNDKFAIDRRLPELNIGDYLVIHTTGAHGHSMGFQYNGKLRSAELLLRVDGSIEQIRRAETIDDYLATLNYRRRK